MSTLQLRSTVNEVIRKPFPEFGILMCASINEQRILKFVSHYGGPNWSSKKCFILDLKVTHYVSALNSTISQCCMMRCVHAGNTDNVTFIT